MERTPVQTFTSNVTGTTASGKGELLRDAVKETKNDFYRNLDEAQRDMLDIVTHSYMYDHNPQLNGGYIILVQPGPWATSEFINADSHLEAELSTSGRSDLLMNILQPFESESTKIAYNIEPGNQIAASDSYNLRHHSLSIFSYDQKIEQVTVTYLENKKNMVHTLHDVWMKFMDHVSKGYVDMSSVLANETEYFFKIPYYGAIWAYSYNPFTLAPKHVMKFIGVYPDNLSNTDVYGSRDKTEHYMKAVSYKVSNSYRSSYIDSESTTTPAQKFNNFIAQSKLMKEFVEIFRNRNLIKHGYLGYKSVVERNALRKDLAGLGNQFAGQTRSSAPPGVPPSKPGPAGLPPVESLPNTYMKSSGGNVEYYVANKPVDYATYAKYEDYQEKFFNKGI